MATRRILLLLLIPALVLATAARTPADMTPSSSGPLLGFSNDHASRQREIEARFDSHLDAPSLREWMKRLSARPHHVGSPYDKDNAEFMAGLFRSWGFQTQIEQFKVLFPTPKTRLLEMVAPSRFTATLSEPPLPEDPTSSQTAEQLPTYNAYSIDGDVTGELVYVNYGVPKDYEELERRGIDVKGKIVIARYFGSWRGIKPKVAAEHGAIGCIIFSDPSGDGYLQGDVYPKGGWRSDRGVQRGSVADMPVYSGDPLTPGVGATENAKRLDLKDATTLTKIPVLPISYGDALPLLKAIAGPMAPEAWRGSLPMPYHLGPGPARVHLKVAFNWNLAPIYDVIARIPGSERPDEWVIRGNHHDAWVNGANDPVSGMVAELAEARALGELVKSGWKPKRTIIYAAWDGEEPGLLGSTEWAETHADELRQHAAVYINSDSNARGFFGAGGSHQLETFVNQVLRDVPDPEKGISVLDRSLAADTLYGGPEKQQEAKSKFLHLEPLGSGSDFTPFLQHLGISALNIGYGGEDEYGQYHSIYDSFAHYTRFVDPTFEYGVALAKTSGRIVMRLADADVLPFDPDHFATAVGRYADEVQKLLGDLRKQTVERNQQLDDKVYEAVDDPTQKWWVAPKRLDAVPYLNFSPLENAVARLKASTAAYSKAIAAATAGGKEPPPETQARLDDVLMKAERALTTTQGLPRRPWYVHQIYAPGYYTGYGVKTLPAVREAIEQRQWQEAEQQMSVVAGAIDGFAKEIDRATALLGPGPAAAGR